VSRTVYLGINKYELPDEVADEMLRMSKELDDIYQTVKELSSNLKEVDVDCTCPECDEVIVVSINWASAGMVAHEFCEYVENEWTGSRLQIL